jgi:hypothetical protein
LAAAVKRRVPSQAAARYENKAGCLTRGAQELPNGNSRASFFYGLNLARGAHRIAAKSAVFFKRLFGKSHIYYFMDHCNK